MARKGDQGRLNEIRESIKEQPGHKAGWHARLLGYDNKTVARALPQLEARGDLLIEDDGGRLDWFGEHKPN